MDRRNLAQVQFSHQASFIDAFDQTRSHHAVNLDSRADGNAAQLISLLEKCMHAGGVHQGNKDNEGFCLIPLGKTGSGLILPGEGGRSRGMRRFFILAWLLVAPAVWAGEGRVVKALPQFLDKRGRHALSPSLYERDAYQFSLRRNPSQIAALRLAVQWKAKDVDWSRLKLRAEMRGLAGDSLHTVTLEEPAKKSGHFSSWSEFKIEGGDYAAFGGLVAWRVSLWEGDRLLGRVRSPSCGAACRPAAEPDGSS